MANKVGYSGVPSPTGLVMLLVGVWRTWGDFDQENWFTNVYVGGPAVTLVFLIGMSAWLERSAARQVAGTAPAAPTPSDAASSG